MAERKRVDVDEATGMATTGHEWDGLRELNTPLPRWWVWIFYATIIWAIGYWLVYPSWPLVSSYTSGIFGWRSRAAVTEELDALRVRRATITTRLAGASLEDIAENPELLSLARAQGRFAFSEYCVPCHGPGAGGAKGYPNLIDDEWIWGGTLEQIAQTIRYGVRSADEKTRVAAAMPAFGRDGLLKPQDIDAVADYVRSLARLPVDPKANLTLGAKVFAENCALCHADDGKGKPDVGASNLTDAVWLYGPDKATIVEGIVNGRGAVMPAWAGRLDDVTIKALAVYIYSLGGGR
jgi:cytochrome c oxidase cbb3-type subunit 3